MKELNYICITLLSFNLSYLKILYLLKAVFRVPVKISWTDKAPVKKTGLLDRQ